MIESVTKLQTRLALLGLDTKRTQVKAGAPQASAAAQENNSDSLAANFEAAIGLLAEWCVSVEANGSNWDDWDEHYKDAAYRPGPLRADLDLAIAKEKKLRGITT